MEGVQSDELLSTGIKLCQSGSVVLECKGSEGLAPIAFPALLAPCGLMRPMVGRAEKQSILHELKQKGLMDGD